LYTQTGYLGDHSRAGQPLCNRPAPSFVVKQAMAKTAHIYLVADLQYKRRSES